MAKNINFKYAKKIFSNTLTYKLTFTLNIILAIFCMILVTLYILGNYQGFQDNSQSIILQTLSYVALFNTLLSVFLLVETVIKIFTEKRKFRLIVNAIYLFFAILIGSIFTTFSNVISFLARGI